MMNDQCLPRVAVTQRMRSCLSSDWVWGLILLLAVILVYTPVWWAGYVWDDDVHLTANPCIIGPLGLKEIWTTHAADVCPLTLTTFWAEHKLWGLAPLPYHLVNILLHGACAILLWRVLRGLQVPGAWLGAALWALHPVQVESVAWITEMKNTESCVFFLLSILFYVKNLKEGQVERQSKWKWNYSLTLLFAALALASKSSTVILPIVLCLCAWWMEGRWQWRNLLGLAPIFLMSIVAGSVSLWLVDLQGVNSDFQWVQTWPERLVTAGDAVWFYLGKLLWPHPLIAIYPRWEADAGAWFSYLPLLAVIVTGFILWLKRESWSRPWFFALGYFLVALLPVLGLLEHYFLRYSLVAFHFQYLAAMGPLALAGAGIARFADSAIPQRPSLQATLGAGALLILGILSWQRAWVYGSEETLWTDTLAKNPNCWLGYNNLGKAFSDRGQFDEAMASYQKSLAINPNYSRAHFNLGLVLSQKGEMAPAMAEYRKVLDLDPNFVDAHYNLANDLFQMDRVDDAIVHYRKVLEINPDHVEANNNLGYSFFEKGQIGDAIVQYRKALRVNPNFFDAHYNLGIALIQTGRIAEATAEFQEAVRLNPSDLHAQSNLARAQAMARQGGIQK
jgi:tetratricopeptide (TPR) repeat protein